MKTIGIIGGMSWESSALYYQWMNELVREKLGGLHSAQILMHSYDFQEIEYLQVIGDWAQAGQVLARTAANLQGAGADCIVLATNTMHKLTPDITNAIDIPFLHIADATAQRIQANGIEQIGLLGTHYTMEDDFYAGRLRENFGLDVLVPEEPGRNLIHDVIYDELVVGKINDTSRTGYVTEIQKLVERGAQGIILGCTEITMLVGQQNSTVPVFDTTRIHVEAAVEFALG